MTYRQLLQNQQGHIVMFTKISIFAEIIIKMIKQLTRITYTYFPHKHVLFDVQESSFPTGLS